jgi:hypothetical protein
MRQDGSATAARIFADRVEAQPVAADLPPVASHSLRKAEAAVSRAEEVDLVASDDDLAAASHA